MKKNTLVAIILIIFDIALILLSKIIFSKRDYYRIIPHYYKPHPHVAGRKRCNNSQVLKRKNNRDFNAKSSNDELIELIKQFFGGKRK